MKTRLTAAFAPVPGIALTGVIAFAALLLSDVISTKLLGFEKSPVSGIMMAILIGILAANFVSLPGFFRPGIAFSVKTVLRVGIVLLGIRLSLGQVAAFGARALPVVVVCIAGALLVAGLLGRKLGISDTMSTLIAVGTGICGATAIVATAPGLRARDEETAYAVANITIFGIAAMFLYPYLSSWLFGGDSVAAGIFLGSSIHETAQVAGAGMMYAEIFDMPGALDAATVTKLMRNTMMAVVVPLVLWLHCRRAREQGGPRCRLRNLFPTFILGFLLMALVRTAGDATLEKGRALYLFSAGDWNSLVAGVNLWSERLLAVAMAGVGAGTRFRDLRKLGIRPFWVGLGAAITVGLLSLAMLKVAPVVRDGAPSQRGMKTSAEAAGRHFRNSHAVPPMPVTIELPEG